MQMVQLKQSMSRLLAWMTSDEYLLFAGMSHLLQLAILFLLLQALQQHPRSAPAKVPEWLEQHPYTSWPAPLQATYSNATTC